LNRLILIGNGFDLAHGLKSSYHNFINDFWEKEYSLLDKNYRQNHYNNYYEKYTDDYVEIDTRHPMDLLDILNNNGNKGIDFFFKPYICQFTGQNYQPIVKHNYSFLEIISDTLIHKNWVDIEIEYNNQLLKLLNSKEYGSQSNEIDKLNNEFDIVKLQFIAYLSSLKINTEGVETYIQSISDKINTNIVDFDFTSKIKKCRYRTKPKAVLFLNFNYSSLSKLYDLGTKDSISYNTIHIHGELNNPKNPIIFGYGDELATKYREMEEINDNRFQENVKSIRYLETPNYREMLMFLESDEYQVFIMGLSCGSSDRTLLNTIFEHENCKSIKIYYHKKSEDNDDFANIVTNISRCFNDKKSFRAKVVNKEYSPPVYENDKK